MSDVQEVGQKRARTEEETPESKFDLNAELKGVEPFINPNTAKGIYHTDEKFHTQYEPYKSEYSKAHTNAVCGDYDLLKRVIVTQRKAVEVVRADLRDRLYKLRNYEAHLTKLMKK